MNATGKKARKTIKAVVVEGPVQITGVLKDWNAQKGFGFVAVDPEYVQILGVKDVFLHVRVVRQEGYLQTDLEVGMVITGVTKNGEKGWYISDIDKLEKHLNAEQASSAEPVTETPSEPLAPGEVPAKLKFFNAAKGFGFVIIEDKEVFVHVSALNKRGINPAGLKDGTEVVVVATKPSAKPGKAPEVAELRLA